MTDNLHRKTLLHLLKDRAYKHGQFTLSSGKETEHYINCKPVTLSCEGNALLSHLMIKKVDEVIDLCTDITIQMRPSIRETDPKLRTEMRKELSETILPRWLGFLEKLLEDNGDKGFFVGNSISVADLAVWRLCAWISGGIIDGIPTNLLEGFTLLSVHQREISNLPKVMEWVKKTHK